MKLTIHYCLVLQLRNCQEYKIHTRKNGNTVRHLLVDLNLLDAS